MNVEFSQIPAKLNYPRQIKGKLSSLHSDIITYVSSIYDGSYNLRSKTVRLLNTLTWYLVNGDALPPGWSSTINPFDNIDIEAELVLKEQLGNLYINPRDINWDIAVVASNTTVEIESSEDDETEDEATAPIVSQTHQAHKTNKVKLIQETDKSDLYIAPPSVPQFDTRKPWMSTLIDDTVYCIYTSIPLIPTKQNEISVTTDVNMMSEAQLLNLYPNNYIKTRSPLLYEPLDGCKYHSQLGVILPIEGFTEEECIDNIIRYPHLFKLSKIKDGEVISFYNTIEIDGELKKISEVWKVLPDTSKIPYTADFVKEYVVRRYLLERDHDKVQHKYPMYGELDPYLTLFTTPTDYIQWGYSDIVGIAKMCVESRVAYKRSRNPVMRRIQDNV